MKCSLILLLIISDSFRCHVENETVGGERNHKTGPKPPWNETYIDRLRNDLLTSYDKYARPGNHDEPTIVHMKIVINRLETDEFNSTVSVSCWFMLFWVDPKLKWNKNDYGGMITIKMADHEVWQPDIFLQNSASGGEPLTRYGNPNVIVHSNGVVVWYPPSRFLALCEFNLYYWPFDVQNCFLKFTSWTHSGKYIRLERFEKDKAIGATLEVSPWKVDFVSEVVTTNYSCCIDPFYNVNYNLTLTRKSTAYVAVVVTPLVVVIGLILIQFCVPPKDEQRIILNCCTLIVLVLLLTYFFQKLPVIGYHTPWLVTFYSTSLFLIVLAMVESTLLLLIFKNDRKGPLPSWIKMHLDGRFGNIILLSQFQNTSQNEPKEENRDRRLSSYEDRIAENATIIRTASKSSIEEDWENFATAVDRIVLLCYSSIIFVLLMCYVI